MPSALPTNASLAAVPSPSERRISIAVTGDRDPLLMGSPKHEHAVDALLDLQRHNLIQRKNVFSMVPDFKDMSVEQVQLAVLVTGSHNSKRIGHLVRICHAIWR